MRLLDCQLQQFILTFSRRLQRTDRKNYHRFCICSCNAGWNILSLTAGAKKNSVGQVLYSTLFRGHLNAKIDRRTIDFGLVRVSSARWNMYHPTASGAKKNKVEQISYYNDFSRRLQRKDRKNDHIFTNCLDKARWNILSPTTVKWQRGMNGAGMSGSLTPTLSREDLNARIEKMTLDFWCVHVIHSVVILLVTSSTLNVAAYRKEGLRKNFLYGTIFFKERVSKSNFRFWRWTLFNTSKVLRNLAESLKYTD